MSTTTVAYNADNRYIGYTDAQGASTRFELDAYGQRTATVDALGRITRYHYDASGNLTRSEQPDGSHYTLSYNAQRKLVAIADALDRTTRYVYDERGNLVETVQPDGATTSAFEAGRCASSTHAAAAPNWTMTALAD